MDKHSPIYKALVLITAIQEGKPINRTEVRERLEKLIEAVRRP
jgi:hypothetical protein